MPAAPAEAAPQGTEHVVEETIRDLKTIPGFQSYLILNNDGIVIKPNSFKAVYDEGMPTYQSPFQKGKLFIQFTVKFPAPGDLSDDDLAALANVLGKPTAPIVTDDHEECTMHDVDMESEMRRNKQQQKQATDDSDDEGEGGQRVQCAQQ